MQNCAPKIAEVLPEYVAVSPDSLCVHPRLKQIFGGQSQQEYDRLKASILKHGILDPIDVSPPDASEFGDKIVDGAARHAIALETGIAQVPVRIVRHLRTFADQALYALAKTKRKDLTESQRAAQEAAVAEIIRAAAPSWREENGYDGLRNSEIVATVLDRAESSLRRRQKVFLGDSSTAKLRSAVDDGLLPLRAAYELVNDVEAHCEPGSERARTTIDEAVQELRRAGRRRRSRQTSQPEASAVEDARDRQREFWQDIEQRLGAFVQSRAEAESFGGLRGIIAKGIVSDLISDVRVAAAEAERRLKSLNRSEAQPKMLRSSALAELNACRQKLGLCHLTKEDPIDVAELRSAFRRQARFLHPDVNQSERANEDFAQLRRAYERGMELTEQLAV